MEPEEPTLAPISAHPTPSTRKPPCACRIFSLLVLATTLAGVWQWCGHYSAIAGGRAFGELTRNDLLDAVEFDNGLSV